MPFIRGTALHPLTEEDLEDFRAAARVRVADLIVRVAGEDFQLYERDSSVFLPSFRPGDMEAN